MKTFEELYYEAPSFWEKGAVLTERLVEIAEMLPNGTGSILDVGCGNGEFGHYLQQARPEIAVTGVDRSEQALSHVRFDKRIAAIDRIPFDDGSFDAVSCLQVLEHLHARTSAVALRELARVARRWLIIEVPFREDTAANRTECPRCHTEFNVDLHLDSFDDRRLEHLFDEHGFSFVRMFSPDRKEHLLGIDAAVGWLKALRAKRPRFMSPICPLCGYSEGDRTAGSLLATRDTPPRTGVRKAVGDTVRRHWPKVQVTGYSAVSLYERRG